MKLNNTRHTYARDQRVGRPRRWLLPVGILCLVLLLCVCGFIVFSKNKTSPVASPQVSRPVKVSPPRPKLSKDAQIAWPGVGQAAIGTVEDGVLAHSSASELQRPTASMAKIITALAVMKKQPLKPGQAGLSYAVTAGDVANYHAYAAVGGSALPVYEGMVLTQYQAMQAMLLPSANNIALLLAERTFGSMDAYASYAQNMLRTMGLRQTMVTDATGFDPATASTPSDLVKIGIAALKNPVIAEIVAQKQAEIPGAGIVKNTNELLGDDGVIGLKTGRTDNAGSCLLFAGRYTAKDGQAVTIVGVIMGDANAASLFGDSRALLASAKQGFGLPEVAPASETPPTTP